jgi:hypothetical protein
MPEENFYLYCRGPKDTLELIPESKFKTSWTRLRELEGMFQSQLPVPAVSLKPNQVDMPKYEHEYRGKFKPFG